MNLLFWKKKKKEDKSMNGAEQHSLNELKLMIKQLEDTNKQGQDMLVYFKEHIKELQILKQKRESLPNSEIRDIAVDYVMRYIGTFYSWGGDDPSGFDCSGIAIEMLKAVGLMKRKVDATAAMLWEKFKDKQVNEPYKGCLVFWYNNTTKKIIHIEICINNRLSVGASGGGSRTKTKEDAIRDNAFIKMRPFKSRAYIHGFVDPFK